MSDTENTAPETTPGAAPEAVPETAAGLSVQTTAEEAPVIKVDPLERTLELTVSADELARETAAELRKIGRTAKLRGFRPGHVPPAKVAEMYGAEARGRVLGRLVDAAWRQASAASGLAIASPPAIAPVPGPGDGASLRFEARFEVMPEITTPDLSALELKRYRCQVAEPEVEKTLDIMARQRTTWEVEEGRIAADGDRVTVNFRGLRDGAPFEGGSAEGYQFVLGGGMMLPQFDQAVAGLSAGAKKTFPLTFPENYQNRELAGQDVTFEVECVRVEKGTVPPVDDRLARQLGLDSAAALIDEVRRNLEREVRARVSARTRAEVLERLRAACPFPVPQALVRQESERMAEQVLADFRRRGLIDKRRRDLGKMPLEMFAEQAGKRIALSLLVGHLVEERKLAPSEDRVLSLVRDAASAYEAPEEMEKHIMSDPSLLASYRNLALEQEVVDFVLGQARTTDQDIPFDELMQNQRA